MIELNVLMCLHELYKYIDFIVFVCVRLRFGFHVGISLSIFT